MLSEVLSRTPIVRGADAGPDTAAGGSGGAGGFDWVDPEVDPELALALRLSMETAEQERKKVEGVCVSFIPKKETLCALV